MDYDEGNSGSEKERNIRGSREKRYIKIPDGKLGEILEKLGVKK